MMGLRVIRALSLLVVVGCGASSLEPTAADTEQNLLSDIELNTRMYECIAAEGFTGFLSENVAQPGYSFQVSPEREAIYWAVVDVCGDDLVAQGLKRGETVLASEDDLNERYDYLLLAAECLTREGIRVPEAPSREAYVTSGGFEWVPHAAVLGAGLPADEIDRLFRVCPQ